MEQPKEPKVLNYKVQFLILILSFVGLNVLLFTSFTRPSFGWYKELTYRLVFIADSSKVYFAALGAGIALARRGSSTKKRGDKSFLSIIINDFTFDYYATLSLLSFMYAITQGACFGVSIGYTFLIGANLLDGNHSLSTPLFGILSSLIIIVVSRLVIEGYTVVYRTAQDAGEFFRKQN
jgi:hypothetical protein